MMKSPSRIVNLASAVAIGFVLTTFFSGGTQAQSQAEPVYATRTMILGGQTLTVEMAITQQQQEHGLMFRQSLKDNAGMLFVYSNEQVMNFWMKNTFIPLAIGFFDKDRRLIDIQEMAAMKSEIQTNLPIYRSRNPAMFALEVNKGWFARHHIHLGATFRLLKSPMKTKPVMRKGAGHWSR